MSNSSKEVLFDFTTMDTVSDWYEVSDTVRTVGMSKASLVLQKTKVYQRAIFFALLNPQPNGACFAGMSKNIDKDFSGFLGLEIKFRSQSANIRQWKIVLRTDSSIDRFTSYQQLFDVQPDQKDFETIFMPFEDFHQDVNGTVPPDETPLDLTKIKSIGIQAFGGVYEDFKQSGPATLELDFISLVSVKTKL